MKLRGYGYRVLRDIKGPLSRSAYRKEIADLKAEVFHQCQKTGKICEGLLRITNPDGTVAELTFGIDTQADRAGLS